MLKRVPKLCEQPDGRCFVWVPEGRGRRRKLYFGQSGDPASCAAYQQWAQQIRLANQSPIESDRTTVADLTLSFMEHAKRHYRKNGRLTSEVHAMRAALRPLNRLFGGTLVTSFGPRRLMEVRDAMVHAGMARKAINRHVVRIRTVFRWGIVQELVPAYVVTALEQVRGLEPGRSLAKERPDVKPVALSVLIRTMCHLRPVVRSMILTQALTAMRPAELVSMTLGDIDRSGDVWLYRPKTHKLEHKRKERVIPIGPRAQRHILAHCLASPDTAVFRTTQGTAFTPSGYRQAIQKPCKRHDVPLWSPNQLRHLGATLIRRNASLEVSRVILGHSSAATTEIYAERDLQTAKQIASAM